MMFGVSSMTTKLRRVALQRPGKALFEADRSVWHYGPTFDPDKVAGNHRAFVDLLEATGIEILWLDAEATEIADAIFTYDASLMTPQGAILMSPGKLKRAGEQDLHRSFYEANNIPIFGEITGTARAEAGDTLWLDDKTLVIGRGFRTNPAGVEQLETLMQQMGVTTHVFDLPVYLGADACLHLMSLISLVDTKKALVCLPLLPVGLWELLQDLGIQLIEAPYSEFEQSGTLSTNILATSPGQCIMIDGLPQTRSALINAGIDVQVFDGDALCIGCEGGPTCLTRPILRS